MLPDILNPRHRSLVRGNALVLSSLLAAFLLSDFPHNRATLLLLLPAITAVAGTVDTIRCIRPRWNLYHGGVILCIYMDLMAIAVSFFLLLYPYLHWIASSE